MNKTTNFVSSLLKPIMTEIDKNEKAIKFEPEEVNKPGKSQDSVLVTVE